MKLPPVYSVAALLILAGACSAVSADKLDLSKALSQKVSVVWDRKSLEEGLVALAAKVKDDHPGFAIKISGDDLKLEGITRNQAIRDVKLEDKTVAEVLTALVMKGDPNGRVKEPSDPNLKLVWIIAADPADAERKIILITTRAAAKKRGDKLPDLFEKVESDR